MNGRDGGRGHLPPSRLKQTVTLHPTLKLEGANGLLHERAAFPRHCSGSLLIEICRTRGHPLRSNPTLDRESVGNDNCNQIDSCGAPFSSRLFPCPLFPVQALSITSNKAPRGLGMSLTFGCQAILHLQGKAQDERAGPPIAGPRLAFGLIGEL